MTKFSITGHLLQGGRPLGVMLIIASTLFFSTAGVFTKGVYADAWSVIFWRGVFAALLGILYLGMIGRLRTEMRRMRRVGWCLAFIYASGTAAFIPAFKMTSIANVALIWSSAPLLAAMLAWLWFRQTVSFGFVLATLLAALGTLVVVWGSFGSASLAGDLLAVWMTAMMVLIMTIYRCYPDAPTTLPTVMASLILLPVAWLRADPMLIPLDEIMITSLFGVTFVVASVTLSEGSRHLAPGETALLSLGETPLAILLALLILAEYPSVQTLVGGGIIMAAVGWYQWAMLRAERQSPKRQ